MSTSTPAAPPGRAPLPWEPSAPPPTHDVADSIRGFALSELQRGGARSMSGISLRGFLLGMCFSMGVLGCGYNLAIEPSAQWRPFFFLAALSLFHFLEFWVTAAFNAPRASVAAFLLSSNGRAYQVAHFAAFAEAAAVSLWFPVWQAATSSDRTRALGLLLVVLGQAIRTAAMATAGTNFNHFVQQRKARGHELVTWGVYRFLRHPSYFGFFWWAIGTQMVLGNVWTGMGFVAALWDFFRRRIPVEESFLYAFFGDDYKSYARRSWIGIPLVRGSPRLREKN